MKKYKTLLLEHIRQPKTFIKWLILSLITGLIVGGVSTGFYYALSYVTALRISNDWLIFLLPIGGIIIILLYRVCQMEKDRGTNFVLVAVRENAAIPLSTAPLVFIATVITHLFGGSAGREGAILQIGGSLSSSLGRLFHLDDKDSRIITMCGMSAAFSALFGTPLTAAVFSMEVISVGVMYYSALVPCLLSSIIGFLLASFLGVSATRFFIPAIPELSFLILLKIIALAVLFAALSVLFCRVMRFTSYFYNKFLPNPLLRAAVGGTIIVLLTLIVSTKDYNGAGGAVISAAISGNARPEAFLLKILFTAITLGAGFKGGEIIPVFFAGSTFGCTAAPLLGLSPSLGAALGLASVFCGVTNCPIASIMLAAELFGGKQLPVFALSCAVSYMLSGYYSLYSEQKILYSKLKPIYIDKKAN
ncbi:MAG: chloride channel protein [Clostridiales bacterium]|nr:chloride channel protein [Clostridiales bacterium]